MRLDNPTFNNAQDICLPWGTVITAADGIKMELNAMPHIHPLSSVDVGTALRLFACRELGLCVHVSMCVHSLCLLGCVCMCAVCKILPTSLAVSKQSTEETTQNSGFLNGQSY